MNTSCAFCTLPEIKDREIVGNDLAWSFPTNIPIVPGHTLIVPRRCVPRYEDLTREEMSALEDLRRKIVIALRKQFGALGFNFAWNDGTVAGQSVPHFHLHVIPRVPGDAGVVGYEPREIIYRPGSRSVVSESDLQTVAQRIRQGF